MIDVGSHMTRGYDAELVETKFAEPVDGPQVTYTPGEGSASIRLPDGFTQSRELAQLSEKVTEFERMVDACGAEITYAVAHIQVGADPAIKVVRASTK